MKKFGMVAAALLAIALAGCNTMESQRTAGGALIGGAAGAVVGGVASGNAGGALAGAAIGAAGGAIIGHATTPRASVEQGYAVAPDARCIRPGFDYYGNRVCFGYAVPAPYHFGNGVVYYEDTYRRPYPYRY